MPIRPPALDDRSFQDLSAEMLRRIPAHTPEWTNPQPGDPGRTIIDLMAWLADTILYRANLIPERQRLAFLKLLGVGLRPAHPARGLISLSHATPTDVTEQFCPQHTALLKPVHFETLQEVNVLPLAANCFIKRSPNDDEKRQFESLLGDLSKLYGTDPKSAAPYVTTSIFPKGAAEPLGRDIVATTVDASLWIALSAQTPALVPAVRALMASPKFMNVGVAPVMEAPLGMEDISIRRPIPMVWEIHSLDSKKNPQFNRLSLVSDGSHGLTMPGVIALQLPGLTDSHAPTNEILRAGRGEQPPRIDDPVAASSILAWIRLRPEASAKLQSLSLSWADINAVTIEQLETMPGRRTLGQGNGASGQQFNLGLALADADALQIDVTDDQGQPRPWRRVDDTAGAGRDEPVFSVDLESGVIQFGDGVRGRAPQIGSLVQAYGLRGGGGSAGNLAAGTLKDIDRPGLKVNQPLATAGGAESETLEEAERRIPQFIRNQDRAVNEGDFRNLAMQTPGLALGRVEVLPRFKPHQRKLNIPGVVSVICLPRVEGFNAPAPRPDRPTLESIHAWLDPRRPLSTELYVVGCEYVPVALSVAVEVVDPDRRTSILNNVKQALKEWLWALPPGGPTGQGWPLGRRISDRELEVVVARVEGVDGVAPVLLFDKEKNTVAWRQRPFDDKGLAHVDLLPWQLPELLNVVVIEGTIADPAAITSSTSSSSSGNANSIAIPIVPEVC